MLLAVGDRYEKLVERTKESSSKLDDESARDLNKRPVYVNSDIHSMLFAPETLGFWVANADSTKQASHTRYTEYTSLAELVSRHAEKHFCASVHQVEPAPEVNLSFLGTTEKSVR